MTSNELCINCGNTFEQRNKAYNRAPLSSTIKTETDNIPVQDILLKHFSLDVTPDKVATHYLCSDCLNICKKTNAAETKLQQSKEQFQQKTSSTSYVHSKRKLISTASPSSHKRRAVTFTPQKRLTKSNFKTSKKDARDRAARLIQNSKYDRAVRGLMNSPAFLQAIKRAVQSIVRKEINGLLKDKQSPFRESKNLEDFTSFSWSALEKNVKKSAPFFVAVLESVVNKPGRVAPQQAMLMCIAQLLFSRNRTHYRRVQEMVGVQLWLAGCKREVCNKLFPLAYKHFRLKFQCRVQTLHKISRHILTMLCHTKKHVK